MERLNQIEYKNMKAGEVLFSTAPTDNVLVFVSTGELIIYSKEGSQVTEVPEGYFILLPRKANHKAMVITSSRVLVIHAGPLSDMIINDPEWNAEKPVVLPILPALAHTLNQIEYYSNDRYFTLN